MKKGNTASLINKRLVNYVNKGDVVVVVVVALLADEIGFDLDDPGRQTPATELYWLNRCLLWCVDPVSPDYLYS